MSSIEYLIVAAACLIMGSIAAAHGLYGLALGNAYIALWIESHRRAGT